MVINDRWLTTKEVCSYIGIIRQILMFWIEVKESLVVMIEKIWRYKKNRLTLDAYPRQPIFSWEVL